MMTQNTRVALWFGSLLVSVSLFSLAWGVASFLFVFRITMTFAIPVAFLYLPFVFGMRDAEQGRIWKILVSGVLIGPVALAILITASGSWRSDDVGLGPRGAVWLALIVGLMTTGLYVTGLKIAGRSGSGGA